ncbi:hypothetical protein E8E13_009898 [Curvularia kusanoi]|uniref:FAD-binding FR-type domain-containing protein n=1 Tax=Curvularia kusanoi TaxID=90978 RepID=A0A9P4TPQ2_CURKU|nr:hypothetical protein E8E13_009898 [Curvularia kusanoi]
MTINISLLVLFLAFRTTADTALTATAANLAAAVILRQEDVINTAYTAVSKLPTSLPYAVRRALGDLHHFGGAHVGCALSALLWYILFTGLNTIRVLGLMKSGTATAILIVVIVTAYAALLAILLVCITALPRFRVLFHNTFEATHRFGGWTAILVLWLHTGTSTLTPDAYTPLYIHPSLWLLILTTSLLILPWLRIRRVPITTHRLSPREIQLTFPFADMPYTSTIRISTSPLTEWHAFATIPVTSTRAALLISAAGDWTTALSTTPPSHLWLRHPPTRNFLALAPLFKSLLLVATGAGIGPLLSLLASPGIQQRKRAQRGKVRVLWCVAEPEAPHWGFVLEAVRGVDKDARVFDSRAGRPDVAFEARVLALEEGVEAVMVVSNPKVTGEVVNGCKGVGIAAYGAVFDS